MPRKAVFPDDLERLMTLGQEKLSSEDYQEFRQLLLGINRKLTDLQQQVEAGNTTSSRVFSELCEQQRLYEKLEARLKSTRKSLWDSLRAIDELDILEENLYSQSS